MASFNINLFNSLAPKGKRVIITGILEQVDFQETVDGEVVWILRLQTNANGEDGNPIDPVYIVGVTEQTLTEEIKKAVSEIASQIDWTNVEVDALPPFIQSIRPGINQEDVEIESIIEIRLRDAFPTVGIDPSTVKLRVNGIDVTGEIDVAGKENDYTVRWDPPRKLD